MHDLRYDPDAPATPTRGYSVVDDWMLRHDPNAHAIDARNLRTVPMPDLRSPDTRTFDERMDAELTALRLSVQELRQAVDDLQRMVMEVRA